MANTQNKKFSDVSGYELSRKWFDFCFLHPENSKTNHTAVYFFAVEHCNRMGWKEKFGIPTTMTKEAIGIKSYNTYINTFNDLVDWGFFKIIERSKNQYSSNIISLIAYAKNNKALDKALIKHGTKQIVKQRESIDSINKQYNKEPLTNILDREAEFKNSLHPFLEIYGSEVLNEFYLYWTEKKPKGRKMLFEMQKTFDVSRRLQRWVKNTFNKKEKSTPKKEKKLASEIIQEKYGIK